MFCSWALRTHVFAYVVLCAALAAGFCDQPLAAQEAAATEAGLARGQDTRLLEKLAQRWRWRVFDRDEGVSPGVVGTIFWSRDDYLHAATDRGLSRYDLHHWSVVENTETLTDGPIRQIAEGVGDVYCASERVLWRGARKLDRVYPDQGLSERPIFLSSNRQGQVFLIEGDAHYRVRKGRLFPLEDRVRASGAVLDYAIQQSLHWVAAEGGLIYRDLTQRRWVPVRDRDLPFVDRICVRLLDVRKPPQTPVPQTERSALQELWGVFEAREGSGTWRLARLEGRRWIAVGNEDGLPSLPDSVTTDGEGRYLVSCADGQLYVLRGGTNEFATWLAVEALGVGPSKVHGALLDSRGNLWFRLEAGGVAYVDLVSDRWRRLRGRRGPPFSQVRSLIETQDGALWVGTDEDLVVYPPGGHVADAIPSVLPGPQVITGVDGERFREVTALGQEFRGKSARGRVWLGSENFSGVYFFESRDGGTTGDWGKVDLDDRVHRIVTDIRGELWFLPGRNSNPSPHVHRLSVQTSFEHRSVPIVGEALQGITGLEVSDLVRVPSDDDVFWLATNHGLLRARLERSAGSEVRSARDQLSVELRLTEKDGFAAREIWAVEEGPGGAIWICYPSSGRGVTRIRDRRGQQDAEARFEIQHFDVKDGLAGPEVFSIVRAGHQLWFATNLGLSRFDGDAWYSFPIESAEPRSSTVLSLLPSRDDESLLVGSAERWVLRYRGDDRRRPRVRRISYASEVLEGKPAVFSWRARDYKNHTTPDELIVRYRLDNDDWREVESDGQVELETVGLPTGRHVFELDVRDLDGNSLRDISDRVHEFWIRPKSQQWAQTVFWIAGGLLVVFALYRGRRWVQARSIAARRYRSFFTESPAAVVLLGDDAQVVDYNGAAPDTLGLQASEARSLIGRPARWIPTLANTPIDRLVELGEPFEYQTSFGELGSSSNRKLRVVGFSLAEATTARARWAVVVSDLSRGLAEKDLRERERRLGGLRDFANRMEPDLREIGETIDELRRRCDPEDLEGHLLDRAKRATEHLRSSVGALSSGSDLSGLAVDSSVDRAVSSLFEPNQSDGGDTLVVPATVSFVSEIPSELRRVAVASRALKAALRIVLDNAIEAVSSGAVSSASSVRLSAENRELDDDPGGLPAGHYVEVICADDGPGMGEDQIRSAFDPLYSTKPGEKSRGLGLSTAHAIVRGVGGDIRIHSQPGSGTHVSIILPASSDSAES